MRPAELESAIRANARDLLRYFERRVSEPADAADCLSEVLLVVWRDRDRVPDNPHEARLWMFGIARMTLTVARRQSGRRDAVVDEMRRALDRAEQPDASESADVSIDVRVAMEQLPAIQREVVQLHHWEGLPLVDIADIVGASASTVRSRYAAARSTLAGVLAAHRVGT